MTGKLRSEVNSDLWRTTLARRLVELAIEEDLAFGDLTTDLLVPASLKSVAKIRSREAGVMCGGGVVVPLFEWLGAELENLQILVDGDAFEAGDTIFSCRARTRALLRGERILLNFLQRLSGLASGARKVAEQALGFTVLDTRKTLPGWRVLDKYAVRVGGCRNHRLHLGDMVMIKDNHSDIAGEPLSQLIERAREGAPLYTPIEVEIRSLQELESIRGIPVEAILLDNMDDVQLKACVEYIRANWKEQPLVEASGNITPTRFSGLAKAGVDCASMGALTYSPAWIDLTMTIEAVDSEE